jgi:hypothetical protein
MPVWDDLRDKLKQRLAPYPTKLKRRLYARVGIEAFYSPDISAPSPVSLRISLVSQWNSIGAIAPIRITDSLSSSGDTHPAIRYSMRFA